MHSICRREAVKPILHYIEIIIRQFSNNTYLTGLILLLALADITAVDFKPNVIDQDNMKILENIIIPLKVIGCRLTADEILREWDILEGNQFLLTHISSLLAGLDILSDR
jgi:hypothetical protein